MKNKLLTGLLLVAVYLFWLLLSAPARLLTLALPAMGKKTLGQSGLGRPTPNPPPPVLSSAAPWRPRSSNPS